MEGSSKNDAQSQIHATEGVLGEATPFRQQDFFERRCQSKQVVMQSMKLVLTTRFCSQN